MTQEFENQVLFNNKLKKKLEKYENKANEKKIEEISEKVQNSHQQLKILSKRLKKTEAVLSGNVTPIRLEKCTLNAHSSKLKKIKPKHFGSQSKNKFRLI